MFKAGRWRAEKNKIKAVFKFQFKATQVPVGGWEAMVVTLVPADAGKPSLRSEKTAVVNGECHWLNPIYETVKLNLDQKNGKIGSKIYQFIVSATGSAKSGVLGETNINLADYAVVYKPTSVSLQLQDSDNRATLHVIIQRVQGDAEGREVPENGETQIETSENRGATGNKQRRTLRSQLSDPEFEESSIPASGANAEDESDSNEKFQNDNTRSLNISGGYLLEKMVQGEQFTNYSHEDHDERIRSNFNANTQTEVEASVSCPGDPYKIAGLLSQMAELKQQNESMEADLKEMQERYSEMSLRFAEVEDEIGGEQEHDKKPVMKKVKDKVKKPVIKMKETISKKMHHGHDDEHNDEHREREHDVEDVSEEEQGYEEDEEAEPDPEVHGAPMYESPATSHLIGGQNENLGPGKFGLREAMPATAIEDPAAPKNTGDESRLMYPSADKNPEKVSLGDIIGTVDEDAAAPKGKTEIPTSGGEESQAIVSSPTAGRDKVGESPLLSSFQSMAITENPEIPQPSPPAGTRDQFSPEKEDVPKEEEKQTEHNQQNPPTYTDKLSSVATAAKDAAVSVAATSTEYTKKIASTVLDKASGASTAMMGKGSANETEPKPDKWVSVKEYIVGKTRPGEEDRVLSEVISGAMKSKKQEATLVPETETEAKGSAEESGGGGMGMVDKIKGAVSSWIGAGSVAGGKQASTTSESMDLKGE
ncbi:uncharacterized protein A4U43_C10F16290 [Asparagus officinalis]|uniref:C2 NT-type domain-containing protein n=1 Tax=Asparagus officinalis TaxID=4686 RepID=A0A5P1E3M1_ASPOF|nr:uncharacterized protein A4U43_C10F16290 [Asparagus officinalis]